MKVCALHDLDIYCANVLLTLQRYNTRYHSRKYFNHYFCEEVKIFFQALTINCLQNPEQNKKAVPTYIETAKPQKTK